LKIKEQIMSNKYDEVIALMWITSIPEAELTPLQTAAALLVSRNKELGTQAIVELHRLTQHGDMGRVSDALKVIANVERNGDGKVLPGQGFLYALTVLLQFVAQQTNGQPQLIADVERAVRQIFVIRKE
jgi:hypothetical protein